MLSAVRTHGHFLQPLQPCNSARPLEPSLSHLWVQPVAKLSTCARAICTDTERHTEDTDTGGHRDCHSQGAAINSTHTGRHQQDLHHTSTGRHIPSSSGTGRGKRSLLQAHTHIHQLHEHMYICTSLEPSTAPLSPQHPCSDRGPLTHPTVTYLTAGPT